MHDFLSGLDFTNFEREIASGLFSVLLANDGLLKKILRKFCGYFRGRYFGKGFV